MESKELRIGNYYMFADSEGIVYRKVREIKTNEFGLIGDYDGTNFGICVPVKLTESWLFRLGFEETKSNFLIKGKFEILISENNYVVINDIVLKHIKYLHQLQNLYFLITNEEL